jgi:hypothetical protein
MTGLSEIGWTACCDSWLDQAFRHQLAADRTEQCGVYGKHTWLSQHSMTQCPCCTGVLNLQEKLHLAFMDPEARLYPSEGVHGRAVNPCNKPAECNVTSTPEVSQLAMSHVSRAKQCLL